MSGLRNTLLVTGTDTGVGKTWVSTGLLRAWVGAGLRVAARKPAETGCESVGGRLQPADAAALAPRIVSVPHGIPPDAALAGLARDLAKT